MEKKLTIKEVFSLAYQNHKKNNFKIAEDLYNKILEVNPNHIETIFLLGSLSSQNKNFIKAKKLLQKASEINPNHEDAHNNLGVVFRELGEHKKAIDCYKKAIKIKTDFASAHYNLGIVFKELGEYEKSVNSYEKAIKIRSNFTSAYYNLGIVYKLLKKYEKAIKLFQKVNTQSSRAELLECMYFLNGIKSYQKQLKELVNQDSTNVKIAAMAGYVSKKEKVKNIYPFCKNPLNFIFKKNIKNDFLEENEFAKDLIKLLKKTKSVWEPLSTTTKKGYQTPGNLFNNNDNKIVKLQKIIEKQIIGYRESYKSSKEYFITKWPSRGHLNAWYVKLVKEGYQGAHIHPSRWLSGVFYLKVPKLLNKNEGSIKFQLYGYDYPEDKSLPTFIYSPKDYDLVLFPSSLFHRTIPFTSQDERHCIAFDLVPK